MTEAQLQQRITDLCDWLGLKWHHEVDSRKSKAGWPDLVIAGTEVIFTELKADKGRVSPEQAAWLGRLEQAGAKVYIWRPKDWPEIERTLRRLARAKVSAGN